MSIRAAVATLLATTTVPAASIPLAAIPLAITIASARAQQNDVTPARKTATGRKAAKAANSTSKAEQVSVIGKAMRESPGGGLMRVETAPTVVETVTRAFIARQSPTSSADTLMQSLPSVNVSAADAFGLQGGSNVQMHGLSGNDIGWTLDGAPTYNSGASYSNEIVDAEDLESLSVTPGSSSIDTPTTSAAAGLVTLKMRDPSDTAGGYSDFAWGSLKLNREYIRLETGEIGNSGIKGYVTFSHTVANNFRGPGDSDKKHIDFKFLKDFTGGSQIALEGALNQQYYNYYYYPTASQYRGYADNTLNGSINPDATYGGIDDGSFYRLNEETPFNVVTLMAPSKWVVASHLTISDEPYVWIAYGAGTGGTTLTQGQTYSGPTLVNVDLDAGGQISKSSDVLVDSGFFVKTIQAGNILKGTLQLGHNTLTAGWWYENYNQQEEDPVGKINQATGVPEDIWDSSSLYKLANGQTYYSNHSNQHYMLNTLFVGDTLSLLNDRLTLTGGFKDVMVSRYVTNLLPGAPYRNGVSENEPLPQFQAQYKLDAHNQIFVDAEADYRIPFTSSMVATYGIGSGSLYQVNANPKSEIAIKEEIGYRYHGDLLLADISFFNLNLSNRLLTLNTTENGVQVSETANAGGQTSRGVDLQFSTRPLARYFSPYISFEYLDATIDSDVAALNTAGVTDYLPTAGKTQIMSPKYQGALGVTYDDGRFFGGVNLRYVDRQYSTLMNDEQMPWYITNDVSLGVRLPRIGYATSPKIQLNLVNLTGAVFRNGVYGYQNNAQNAIGVHGTTIAASGSPTYYVAPGFAAVVSFASAF